MIAVERLNEWLRSHQHVAIWSTLWAVLFILYLSVGGGMP